MSTTYEANFGVGFKVDISDELLEKDDSIAEDMGEYIYSNVADGYSTFCTEEDDVYTHYIVIDKPFSNGIDLSINRDALKEEIQRLQLDIEGEFGCYGGIWSY